jgi:hypothetical protein
MTGGLTMRSLSWLAGFMGHPGRVRFPTVEASRMAIFLRTIF